MKEVDYAAVNRCSIDLQPVYEQQYDANNDFKIFGVGDVRQGGIQDMKSKMNMADKLNESSIDNEDQIIEQVRRGTPESNSRSLGGPTQDSSQKSLKQYEENSLPENQEVVSDHEQ